MRALFYGEDGTESAALAVNTGSRLETDAAGSYRAVMGAVHEYVKHTQQAYARGEVHANRAECLLSSLKPYVRVFRGVSTCNLPGDGGFFPCLRSVRQHNACVQAEMIVQAALDPPIARRAKKGALVPCVDPCDRLQTAIK